MSQAELGSYVICVMLFRRCSIFTNPFGTVGGRKSFLGDRVSDLSDPILGKAVSRKFEKVTAPRMNYFTPRQEQRRTRVYCTQYVGRYVRTVVGAIRENTVEIR